MFTKPLLLALLAACGVHFNPTTPAAEQPVKPPHAKPIEAQHFCCSGTWEDDGRNFGSDCETIGADSMKTCRIAGGAVLYCASSWQQGTDGVVSCK
jgi:hypothetical protein